MAIRYVKDFEFPSAAGFTSSAPSKVTGPMFAKGGKVEKEPKGLMVVIGLGKPKAEAKKSRGGPEYMDKGPDTSVPVKGMKGTKKQSTDEDFYGKAKDMPMPTRRPATMKKGGYAEGGKAVKVPLPAEDEAPYPAQWPMPSDEQINKENWNQRKAIRRAMGAKNTGKDTFAKGGMAHDDAAQDKAMIKSMIKPSALKKAMGGPAVQMAKPNAIEASMKGQKKTGYADGGIAGQPTNMAGRPIPSDVMSRYAAAQAAPQGPLTKMTLADGRSAVGQRQVVDPKFADQMKSMGGPRIGVGRSRSGKPDVGAIRAAMARAASQAMPENAPSMMKKGGKVGC